jgi:hypothetical protein
VNEGTFTYWGDISGFDSSSASEQTITITKNSISATFTVTVRPAVLNSLSISSLPDKRVYEFGESSDWMGLEVTGIYSDDTTRIEIDYEIRDFDSSETIHKV